jgi:hypothetical protein
VALLEHRGSLRSCPFPSTTDIAGQRSRGGSLTIRYRSLDQLDEVVRRLERKN